MTERNGTNVSWRELNLALDPLKEDITEIKADVKAMRSGAWFGPRGQKFMDALMVAAIAALVAAGITLIHF